MKSITMMLAFGVILIGCSTQKKSNLPPYSANEKKQVAHTSIGKIPHECAIANISIPPPIKFNNNATASYSGGNKDTLAELHFFPNYRFMTRVYMPNELDWVEGTWKYNGNEVVLNYDHFTDCAWYRQVKYITVTKQDTLRANKMIFVRWSQVIAN